MIVDEFNCRLIKNISEGGKRKLTEVINVRKVQNDHVIRRVILSLASRSPRSRRQGSRHSRVVTGHFGASPSANSCAQDNRSICLAAKCQRSRPRALRRVRCREVTAGRHAPVYVEWTWIAKSSSSSSSRVVA